MITRRTFIASSALGGLALMAGRKAVSLFAKSGNNRALDSLLCGADGKHFFASEANPESHGAQPLSMNPLQIPPVINGGMLTLTSGTSQIFPGTNTNLLLINNSFPAPTIKLKKGDTFSATIQNNLTAASLLHWHGVHAPANMSGHPKDAVPPGASYSVNFPIIQRAGTNFYHAHPDMTTAQQVYLGLAGMFIVTDDEEAALGLPSGDFDIPLLLTDKRFDANQQLIYNPGDEDMRSGWIGDTMLVNGTSNAVLEVAPTLYRFRLVNASNARLFKIGLSDGTSFTLIGNDGGLLTQSVNLTNAMFSPAERLDILIDFSGYQQGTTVTLVSEAYTNQDPPSTCTVPQGAAFDLLQFHVTRTGTSGGTIPSTLSTITPFRASDSKNNRTFKFGVENDINNLVFSLDRIDADVPFGDLEQWTVISQGANTHPVHVHGGQFQVLNRTLPNGIVNPPDPWEMGWKDVVRLDPLGTVNFLVQFAEYTGTFLIHCHKLEHADMGMMSNFEVDPTNAVAETISGSSAIEVYPNPAFGSVTLSFPALEKQETLILVDEKGTVVLEKILLPGTKTLTLETNAFAGGTYRILLGTKHGKLVVIR
ncbi:MAG: multicopper oxidase domain-containing protein [Candidatus Kapaibacterium sp.]